MNEVKKFEGTYWQWLIDEFKGWHTFAWAIWSFGLGFQLMALISKGMTLDNMIAFVSVSIGLLCVSGMIEQRTVNGLLGLISAIGLIYINLKANHPASALDQVFFIALIDLPLIFTWRTWGAKMSQGVRQLDKKGWAIVILIILGLWAILFPTYSMLHDANPLWDSLTLSIGAVASVLFFLRYTQTYNLWLAANIVNVILWVTALTAGYSSFAFVMVVSTIMYATASAYGRFFSKWNTKKATKITNEK